MRRGFKLGATAVSVLSGSGSDDGEGELINAIPLDFEAELAASLRFGPRLAARVSSLLSASAGLSAGRSVNLIAACRHIRRGAGTNCMGSGEFTMLRMDGLLEAQARFSGPTTSGSVHDGPGRAGGGRDRSSTPSPPRRGRAARCPWGCPVRLYVNGVEQPQVVFDTPQRVGTGAGIEYSATRDGGVTIDAVGVSAFYRLPCFSYDASTSFSSISRCDERYAPIDLGSASGELTAACAGNRDCLVDGVVTGDVGFALNTVAVQQALGLPPPPPVDQDASNSGNPTDVASLADTILVATYSWPTTQRDLDTATSFLGGVVGFGCRGTVAGSQYLAFSSDDTSSGGTEGATVLVGTAAADGAFDDSVVVTFAAGWFGSTNRGRRHPAGDAPPHRGRPAGGPPSSGPIAPGVQSGCAATPVGALTITRRGAGARLTFA
ncbi:hypothetical protein I4F81_010789 [Pyropia yezoensis]|uniref:Uncharacterized protein n=1 Tax=Pyropia yezoensis TaxID=2788 RepID=A0ACC3CDY8_PYRYE|nr:hypothetical protein I4F81_010789 [Neopyropia yezoensis]